MKPIVVVSAAAWLLACGLSALAQDAVRFRATSALVMVDVLVTDDRRPVTGLTARDFEILDEGVAQNIEQLYVERLPVNVIMVLDTSDSVEGERLASLKAGANAVVDRLRKMDRAAVLTFSHRLDARASLTDDREGLRKSIATLTAAGSTALRDGAYAGLALRAVESTRTLLLVFSDGVDTASFLEEPRVLEIARRSDATIYGIGVRDAPPPTIRGPVRFAAPRVQMATDDRFLTKLAEETGGRLLRADRNRDITATFERVLEEFNSRYILGFAPKSTTPGWHSLEVRLKNRKATVLARRGYFAT